MQFYEFLLLLVVIAVEGQDDDVMMTSRKQCVDTMTDGCSAPGPLKENRYNQIFLNSCNRHDVCYECGRNRGWSRRQCDTRFLQNMLTTCLLRTDSQETTMRRGLMSWLQHGWKEAINEAKALEHITFLLARSLAVPEFSYRHCRLAAHAFHEAVRGFGASHYGTDEKGIGNCRLPCTNFMGNPFVRIPAREAEEHLPKTSRNDDADDFV